MDVKFSVSDTDKKKERDESKLPTHTDVHYCAQQVGDPDETDRLSALLDYKVLGLYLTPPVHFGPGSPRGCVILQHMRHGFITSRSWLAGFFFLALQRACRRAVYSTLLHFVHIRGSRKERLVSYHFEDMRNPDENGKGS